MSQPIAVDDFTKQLFDFLKETFEHGHGIYLDKGTSLFETLDTLSAEEVSRPIFANSASIAAIVEHMRFFNQVCDDSMRLHKVDPVNWQDSWQDYLGALYALEYEDGKFREVARLELIWVIN